MRRGPPLLEAQPPDPRAASSARGCHFSSLSCGREGLCTVWVFQGLFIKQSTLSALTEPKGLEDGQGSHDQENHIFQ